MTKKIFFCKLKKLKKEKSKRNKLFSWNSHQKGPL